MNDLLDDDTIPTDGAEALADLVAGLGLVVADWGVSSDIGPVRSDNQDAWGQADDCFVVADGMGGHAGGARAARTAVAAFLRALARPWTTAVASANDAVREQARRAGTPGAGTTLVAARVAPDHAQLVSVGDSRVYRWRGGALDLVTDDHTLASEMRAVGVDAENHRRRGVRVGGLTSYLGVDTERLRVDVTEVGLRHGDRLVLLTDGVHGVLDAATMTDLASASTPGQAAHSLVAAALAAGGRDNATALVVEVELVERGDEEDHR